jgi:hypothetical protein
MSGVQICLDWQRIESQKVINSGKIVIKPLGKRHLAQRPAQEARLRAKYL